MSSTARSKRAAEDFARNPDRSSNKKPRFDARNPSTLAADAPSSGDEEDLILNADVIGKSGPQTKRNAVNIDGYDSDSDNDNFDQRAGNRAREKDAAGSLDEEQDDMFADMQPADGDEDEDAAREGKKARKDVRFMEEAEMEGQVMGSTSGGHVSADLLAGTGKGKTAEREASDDDSSGEDEERDRLPEEMEDDLAAEIGAGGKKRHAPRLDAFNLREEGEEGRFDDSGNFVRKAVDPEAVNDNWLDGLSKKEIKKAREAQERREDVQRRKAREEDAVLTSDLLSTLIAHLEPSETPLEALARLNKSKAKDAKIPKWKLKKSKDRMDVDADLGVEAAETARRGVVEALTGAADALYTRQQLEIYETEREVLMRQFKRETGEEWRPAAVEAKLGAAAGDVRVEYRWSDARDGGGSHGPYDAPTMRAWQAAGYFGDGVEFRRVGNGEWSRLLELDD